MRHIIISFKLQPQQFLGLPLNLKIKQICYQVLWWRWLLYFLILIAFITGNSSLEPLIEGLCAQIHVNL